MLTLPRGTYPRKSTSHFQTSSFRFETGSEQVWDGFGASSGWAQDEFETGSEQVWNAFRQLEATTLRAEKIIKLPTESSDCPNPLQKCTVGWQYYLALTSCAEGAEQICFKNLENLSDQLAYPNFTEKWRQRISPWSLASRMGVLCVAVEWQYYVVAE